MVLEPTYNPTEEQKREAVIARENEKITRNAELGIIEGFITLEQALASVRRSQEARDNLGLEVDDAPPADLPVTEGQTPCLCGCGRYPRSTRSRFMPGDDSVTYRLKKIHHRGEAWVTPLQARYFRSRGWSVDYDLVTDDDGPLWAGEKLPDGRENYVK